MPWGQIVGKKQILQYVYNKRWNLLNNVSQEIETYIRTHIVFAKLNDSSEILIRPWGHGL